MNFFGMVSLLPLEFTLTKNYTNSVCGVCDKYQNQLYIAMCTLHGVQSNLDRAVQKEQYSAIQCTLCNILNRLCCTLCNVLDRACCKLHTVHYAGQGVLQ